MKSLKCTSCGFIEDYDDYGCDCDDDCDCGCHDGHKCECHHEEE